MKRFLLAFVILGSVLSAQTHRFIYEYQFKEDSASSQPRKQNMALDINPDEVKFYSYDYVLTDSLNKVRGQNSMMWDDTPAVFRKINTNKNRSFIFIDQLFIIESEDKIDWKLSSDTKVSGGYTLQKATADFGGRKWTAWFSKDTQISEGPYKFRGLPGLIFELRDSKDNFVFNLAKSYKIEKTYDTRNIVENFAGQKPLVISEKTLNKMMLDSFNDPLHGFKEEFKNNKNPESHYFVMGIEVKSPDQFKELTEMMQDRLSKNNNPIELDKAIHYPEPKK